MQRTHVAPSRAGALAFATAALVTTLVTLGATQARAAVSADINLHIGDHPAPVVVFDREPDVVLVPRSRVYYVDHEGYDLYRYGRYWYINDGGFWFRASSYKGPFVGISVGRIPRQVVVVPARYRRHPVRPPHPHGGPPGLTKRSDGRYEGPRYAHEDDDVIVVKEGKSRGKGKGH